MIKQTLDVLKKNPVIILFYVVFSVVSSLPVLAYMPANPENTTDAAQISAYVGRVMRMALLACVISLVFHSGFGKMIAEAVTTGKTKAVSFLNGIKDFFVQLLLAGLFFIILFIGFASVLGIVATIVSIIATLAMAGDAAGAAVIVGITVVCAVYLVMLFLAPIIVLWYPAIFIDDVGPIKGLKNSAKAGVKNYWKLMLTVLVMFIPSLVYMFFNMQHVIQTSPQVVDTRAIFLSPGYWIMTVINLVLSVFILTLLFVIYNKKNIKENTEELQVQ